jgi:hypothetical protein
MLTAVVAAEKVVHNLTHMWKIIDLINFKKQTECPRIYLATPPYMILSQDGETVDMKIPTKDGGAQLKKTMSIGDLFSEEGFEEFIKYCKICEERLAAIRREEEQ